jgi:hypothetical protein
MSPEQETVLLIKAEILAMPSEERDACLTLVEEMLNKVKAAGTVGVLALALIGATMQLETTE